MKGVAYTPFALIAASLLLMLFSVPLGANPQNIDLQINSLESSHTYQASINSALTLISSKSLNAHLKGFNQEIINSNNSLNNPEQKFISSYSLKSNKGDTTAENLQKRLKSLINETEEIKINFGEVKSVSSEGLKLNADQNIRYRYTDYILNLKYGRKIDEVDVPVEGAIDPLNYFRAGEIINYSICGYNKPAYKLGKARQSSGFENVYGKALVEPENMSQVNNKGEKILFSREPNSYELSDFLAVVSLSDSTLNTDTEWMAGFNLSRPVKTGQSVILKNDEAYISHFREIIDRKCFVESEEAPDIFQRMKNSTSKSSYGILTYKYDSNASLANGDYNLVDQRELGVKVSGVSSVEHGQGERSWFRADEDNMDYWNLSSLSN